MALRPNSDLWNYFTNFVEEGIAECKLCKQRLKTKHRYNLKLHFNTVHKNRDILYKYFDINELENLAVCKTCNQHLKNRLCNLRLHMRRAHAVEIHLPEDKAEEYPPPPQPYNEDQITAELSVAKRKLEEQIGNDEKRQIRRLYIKMDKRTIMRAVIGLIVEDGVSPRLICSKHMETVIRPMCEALFDKESKDFQIDEVEIEKVISLILNYIRKSYSNDLHSRLLSIKIDTDFNASANSFCISAQFINEGEIHKRILGVIDLENNDELKETHIKKILYKFNIDSNQIISAFWNNAKHNYNKQVKNSEYLNEIEQFKLYPNIYLGEVKVEPYLGSIAQLCLLDIFKNSKILQKFLECRNLAKFLNDESSGHYGIFDSNILTIPEIDSPWKAGSTYKMMNNLYKARHFLKNAKFEKMQHFEDQFNSNDELWSFIESFVISTNYLQKAILKYNNEELHIGDFYAQWLKCKLLTEKLLSANNKQSDSLLMTLTEVLKGINNRTNELLNQDRIVASLYLDPRFQRILNTNSKSIAIEYLRKLWCRAKLYIVDDSVSNETTTQSFEDNEDAVLNEFLSQDIKVENKESSDVYQKIEQLKLDFQMVDTNVLSFWRDRKISDQELYALSTICFAIPATDVKYR